MDPMQIIQLLQQTNPLMPQPGTTMPAVPGQQRPAPYTPPFLPQNRSTDTIIGQMPNLPELPTMIGGSSPDFTKLRARIPDAFTMPELKTIDPKDTPQRAALQFADAGKMRDQVKKIGGPKDTRQSETEFKNDRFGQGLSAAALAATQGDSLGEVLGLAGGSFLGSVKEADAQRRQETMLFEENARQHQLQMAQLDHEIEMIEAQQANTTSELDFMNLQDMHNAKLAERDQFNQNALAVLGLQQDRLRTELDFATAESNARNNAASATNQARMAGYEAQLRRAMEMAPQFEITPDGKLRTVYVDKDNNKRVREEPHGHAGQMGQIAEQAAMVGGASGMTMIQQGKYDQLARIAPQHFKRNLIMDILKIPGGENVFDGTNAKAADMQNPFDFGTVASNTASWAGDIFTTTKHEETVNNARKAADKVVDATQDFETWQAVYLDAIASEYEEDFETVYGPVARKLNNPAINYALDMLGVPASGKKNSTKSTSANTTTQGPGMGGMFLPRNN